MKYLEINNYFKVQTKGSFDAKFFPFDDNNLRSVKSAWAQAILACNGKTQTLCLWAPVHFPGNWNQLEPLGRVA